MEENTNPLSEDIAKALLNKLAPGSDLLSVAVAKGSFSNYTHIITAKLRDGSFYKIVARRYKVFGDYDRGEKAVREFKAFELLNQHQVRGAEALYLDQTGDVLGMPGIVTKFVEGKLIMDTPADPIDWARKLAKTLAKIHSIPLNEEMQKFLLKGNSEATWFLNAEVPPDYMQEYPGGADLWYLMKDLYPKLQADTPSLLHIDYWSGNILWHENQISAVIDWEEASYGDPACDLAYALMNIVLMGFSEAADEFLKVYNLEMGREPKNLEFWKLAACVRPMTDAEDWKVNAGGENESIFLKFIEDTRNKI